VFKTPFSAFGTKRKITAEGGSSLRSDGSRCSHFESIGRHCDEVEINIAGTKQIITDMVREAKVGRRWADSLNHQLNEITIANRRLSRTGSKILGCWEEQRKELRASQSHINDLYCDLGALKEQLKQAQLGRDPAREELISLKMADQRIPPPSEFMSIDDDCIMVVSPSGAIYADTIKAQPIRKREEFPRLNSPKTPKPRLAKERIFINFIFVLIYR